MQEEVEQRSVNLAVRTTSVTGRVLYNALRSYVQDVKNRSSRRLSKKQTKAQIKAYKTKAKVEKKYAPVHGKQTVKQLLRQGQGAETIDIGSSGAKDFQKIANKYGVDFAIVKDKNVSPPIYTVFFKAKDVDAIHKVLKDFSTKQLKREHPEKSSIIEKLNKFKEIVKNTPRKHREKHKEQER